MTDLPDIDLLEYAKRHLLTHMRESGVSDTVIEEYISRIPFRNPLRNHFARQFIGLLPKNKRETVAERLLNNMVAPVVGLTVHADKHDLSFPVSTFLDAKSVDQLVKRIARSDEESGESPSLRDS